MFNPSGLSLECALVFGAQLYLSIVHCLQVFVCGQKDCFRASSRRGLTPGCLLHLEAAFSESLARVLKGAPPGYSIFLL